MDLRIKRSLAFAVDYLIIAAYAGLLFLLSTALELQGFMEGTPLWLQHIVGFCTLTLPVFAYCTLAEQRWGQTLGKRVLNIAVFRNHKRAIVWRNILKFLPWEMVHTAVYALILEPVKPSGWVWFLAIFPQVLVLLYGAYMLYSKGTKTGYDVLAGSWVGPAVTIPSLGRQTTP